MKDNSYSHFASHPSCRFVVELGHVMHPVEGEILCRCTNEKVPYFNAFVYLENKTPIGKVDEILGPITEQVRRICCIAARAMGAEARGGCIRL